MAVRTIAADDFFAAEEATRRRRLGDEDKHKQYAALPYWNVMSLPHRCVHCGRETRRRGLLCDVCRKKSELFTVRKCACCGDTLSIKRYFADTRDYYCPKLGCRRMRDNIRFGKEER